MIVDLPDTSTGVVAKRIVEVRESGGAISLGRVLTLVVVAEHDEPTEGAISAAIDASREHPSRVIVVSRGDENDDTRLDAQIRVGGDAGASEVVVLALHGELAAHPQSVVIPFLLPDTPVVTWWPGTAPSHPAADPMGMLGTRRLLDASKDPIPTRCSPGAWPTTAPVIPTSPGLRSHRGGASWPPPSTGHHTRRSPPSTCPVRRSLRRSICWQAGYGRRWVCRPAGVSAVSRCGCIVRAVRRYWPSTRTAMRC